MPAPKDTTVQNYSDGPCTTGTGSAAFDRNEGWNWQRDSQTNVLTFVTEPKDIIEDLFKGGTGGNSEGATGKACAASEGSITGIGPDCVKDKEEGEYDISQCFFERTFECLRVYKDQTAEAATLYGNQVADSEWTLVTVNATGGYTPDAGRQAQIDANLAYNACIETVVDECECKECAYTFAKPPEEEEEEDDEEEETDSPTTDGEEKDPLTKVERKTTSVTSNTGPIARVFGRYVVGGNIIWLGKKESADVTRYVTNPTGVAAFNQEQSRCEFFVGICVGELDTVLRVWIKDVLVLSYVIDMNNPTSSAYTDLNLSFLADDSNSTEEAYNKVVQIKLLKGSAAQKVSRDAAELEGFGRVPAYRNLAYLHVKNLDLRLFGGSFPDMRIDVTSMPTLPVINRIETSEYTDLYPRQLAVDPRLNTHIVQQTTGYLLCIDRDTTEQRSTTFDYIYYPMPSMYGRIYGIAEFGDAIVKDPYLEDYQTGGGTDLFLTERGPLIRSYKYYANKRPFEGFVYVALDQSLGGTAFAPNWGNEAVGFFYPYIGVTLPAGFETQALEIASWGGSTYAYQFGMNAANQLSIIRTQLVRNGVTQAPLDPVISSKLPTDIWGSETDLVIYNTIFDGSDTSFIFFASVAAESRDIIFKLRARDLSVAWVTESPYPLSYWNESVPCTTTFAEPNYYFIATDETIVKLERATGYLESQGDLGFHGFPQYQSRNAQFYCALTKSISYVSTEIGHDPKIVRIFMDRLGNMDRPSIGSIIRSLLTQANLPETYIDVSDVEDITVGGYIIQSKTSIREVIETFSEFYRLSLVDDGSRLTLKRQSSFSSAITLDEEDDIQQQTLETRRVVPTSQIDSVTARILDIDNTGLIESIQTVTIAEQVDQTKVPREKRYDLTLYDTGENIRPYLEVALVASRADQDVFSAQLMPRKLAVTANDRVVLGGRDFRITSNYFSPYNATDANASLFFYDVVSEDTTLNGIVINSNARVAKSSQAYPCRPVVLFTNALTEEDALRAATVRQVAYSLIEAHTPDIAPTRLQVYMHAHSGFRINNIRFTDRGQDINVPNSPIYTSAVHTKAAHVGILQQAPESRSAGLFSCSKTDSMRITFLRDDSILLLKNFTTPSAVAQTMDNFIIVNNEYIQFANYEVDPSDPSGRTVTLTNLYRGLLGTDSYTNGNHFDGQGEATNSLLPGARAYLYTPDTIKPFGVSARFTKRNAPATVYAKQFVPAGVGQPDYYFVSDAGSARAWTPTHVKVYRKMTSFGDGRTQINAYLSWKRREPYVIDHLENGGDIPNSFNSTTWLMPRMEGSGGDVVITGSGSTQLYSGRITSAYTVASVESRFTDSNVALHFQNDADGTVPYTTKDILRFNTLGPGVTAYLPASSRFTAIAQITYDEYGEAILGYPLPVRVSPGWPYTNPVPPP